MDNTEMRDRIKQVISGTDYRLEKGQDAGYVLGVVIGNLQALVNLLNQEIEE